MQEHIYRGPNQERSAKEYIVLFTCAAGFFAVLPFAIYRLIARDWIIAAFDLFIVMLISGVFVRVYFTRRAENAAWLLTILFVLGLMTTVYLKGSDQLLWCYPIAVGIYYMINAQKAAITNSCLLVLVFLIVFEHITFHEKALFAVTMIAVNVFTFVFAYRNEKQRLHLHQLSFLDPLTGANNKRAFDAALADALGQKQKKPRSLVLLDIDFFKQVNDTFGHVTGDEVLIKLASLVQINLSQGSKLYRIGGEEYAIFPVHLPEEEALQFAENLRLAVANSEFMSEHQITISLGVSQIGAASSPKDWVRRADDALYAAKRSGRNRSQSYTNHIALETYRHTATSL